MFNPIDGCAANVRPIQFSMMTRMWGGFPAALVANDRFEFGDVCPLPNAARGPLSESG